MQRLFLALILTFAAPVIARAETMDTSVGPLDVTAMAEGLAEPWGLAFLPDGGFLVTERQGRLSLFGAEGGTGKALAGVPEVYATGQGGLLDVMVPRNFATSREVFLSYARPARFFGGGTALGRGKLSDDGSQLEGFTVLFADPESSTSGAHFGSRIVEAEDGSIFLTVGERGEGILAQDKTRANGKVIHLARDGAPLTAIDGALAGVHSMGHRNPQGATLDGDGRLWVVEHGARGGDELNRVEPGKNYGWPVISYGVNYDGTRIGLGSGSPGMEQPVHYWDPSIAPSGLMVYSGKMFAEWAGDFFVGSLKFDYIARLDTDQGFAEEKLQSDQTGRVRDLREGPDGAIWFLSVFDGAVYRISTPR